MITVKTFTFNPFQENTYLLYNEHRHCLIIDPGPYFPKEQEEFFGFIETEKLLPKALLNTHCHLDHIFGNKAVHEKFGLPLQIHPLELAVLEYAPQAGKLYGVPFRNYNGPHHLLQEGDSIVLGEDRLEVFLTPGHSPGSLCFYFEKQKFLIGGDLLFRESIGRSDLPGGDYDTLINSIKTKLWTLPKETIVYSGHGPSTTIGHEKLHNPFLRP